MKSLKSIGWYLVQIPPGLLKSGIPDSVLIPAPVKITIRFEESMVFFSFETCSNIYGTILNKNESKQVENVK
jgi:hypothetical protein